ncbi:uncharacterized protein LOC123723096 [Papilio machaon]|uniref:uncharacterized protein LOC123723096 n=1 Tax=Papilio machaon TaxID=76193 RepID=UPI001E664E88|nr:uncharacterized protein LOC123723096 [Papilio machaon]
MSRAPVQLSIPSWRTTKGCDYIGPRATRLPHAGLHINQSSRRNLTPTWKSASIAYWRELPSFCCFLPFSTIINASDKQQSTRVTSPFVYVYAATCALHSSDHTCVCEQSREAAADYEARSVSPLTSLPSPSFLDCNTNRLDRFQYLEQIRQHFWKRWANEYIAELQQRSKWRTQSRHLKIDDLVLVKEDNTPPLCWRLGRVNRLYPGPDDVPRVADVVTSHGTVRRALNRLCLLPSPEEDLS